MDNKQFVADYQSIRDAIMSEDTELLIKMANTYDVFSGCCGGLHAASLKDIFTKWLYINYEEYEKGRKE